MRAAGGDSTTRILLAVIEARERSERPTYDYLSARVGLSRGTVARHLVRLRRLGLVEWDDNKSVTLHPLVKIESLTSF